MKKTLLLALVIFTITLTGWAQEKRSLLFDLVASKRQSIRVTETIALFQKNNASLSAEVNAIVGQTTHLELDRSKSVGLFQQRTPSLSFILPLLNGEVTLELIQQDINTTLDFEFGSLEGTGRAREKGTQQGLHYRGHIKDDRRSRRV